MTTTTTGDTINGSFGTIDFSNLPYGPGTTDSYSASNGVLTVTTGSNYESVTLNNPGPASFAVSSDGTHGVDVAGAGAGKIVIANQPAGPPVPNGPTDTVVHITFNNVSLASSSGSGVLTGSVDFDFSNGRSQGSYSFAVGGQTQTFTAPNFIPNESPNNMTFVDGDSGNNTLSFSFQGSQPTSINDLNVYDGSPNGSNGTLYSPTGVVDYTATTMCFVTGTFIRTIGGNRAVECLQVGDLAVTASGAVRPIRWIGHRTMRCADAAIPSEVWPVRIRAGAFGSDLPERDLYLSPGHPVLVESDAGAVLVPIMCLVNGTTVARAPRADVTYWHVELDEHDVLLAEGLPAESFHDGGGRSWFAAPAAGTGPKLPDLTNPDLIAPWPSGRCLPVVIEGPAVEAERRRLDVVFATALERAAGWPASARPALAWT